jgi:hypothetical protein
MYGKIPYRTHTSDAERERGSGPGGETVTGANVVAAHQLQLRMDSELPALGLSMRGFVALCTIRDNPGLSRAALARELGIAPRRWELWPPAW